MTGSGFRLRHDFDLPRAIVWEALVDADLTSGWLGEASIDARPDGRYRLDWLGSRDFPAAEGVIRELRAPALLVIDTDRHGTLTFELDESAGGTRGSSTELRLLVDLDVDAPFRRRVVENWERALLQLEGLLRGHPVDWEVRQGDAPVGALDSGADLG